MATNIRRTIFLAILLTMTTQLALAQEPSTKSRPNMVGAYGPWLSEKVLGDGPARLSFRNDKFKSVDEWRKTVRERVWECMAPVDLGKQPEVRVDETLEFDG